MEYPQAVPLLMPYMRKYCVVVSAGSIVVTHPPPVAESLATVRHCSTLLDVSPTWSEYQDAYAPSHRMFTAHSVSWAPRSIANHCGSERWLSQRLPSLPSTALPALLLPIKEDAVAVEDRATSMLFGQ